MPHHPLQTFIREQITRNGPMPFRDFMELALYHREHGFYASGRAAIGRKGDFFTNVSVGALFGQLLAAQFLEMWERLGCPRVFTIVEQGANNGDFAQDVLSSAQANAPEQFFQALRYVLIEPFGPLRERQMKTLAPFLNQIVWVESLDQLELFCGVHFSNELLDAFPVHLVRFTDGTWHERHVVPGCGGFDFFDLPIRNADLSKRTLSLPKVEGYTTEINLDVLAWCDQIAAKLQRGWVLAIDYGYPREIFYSPERTNGTLSCYAAHQRSFDPLQNPGEQDITAHVDFTSLAERAEMDGLRLAGFTDQHHFVVALAKHFFAKKAPGPQETGAFKTLMHPEFLGVVFKVIAWEKGVGSGKAPLRGFEFASNAKVALGLR